MQLRRLVVQNFRGVEFLDWSPGSPFCCLIGPGDSGKSTILDAAEAALSSRWFSFSEPDFNGCDTARGIVIEATVGELSRALLSDERFGLHIRGWTPAGVLRDEPEDGDEPVLTVRLSVDATLEPSWDLVCERAESPRTLSNRDRALFGLVRLAGEDARHLAWGQGSVLSRLTGDTSEAAGRLAEAYKAARDAAKLDGIESLVQAARQAERSAKGLGAYVREAFGPGLELGRSGLSAGAIALHDGGVPLRLSGLGTRRLATLAIQRSAISEGAIVLVDEIEHGLEPHRIGGAISQLKRAQGEAAAERRPVGQILMTTHSDVALSEAGADALRVVDPMPEIGFSLVRRPESPARMNPLMRFAPRALFARRVLVTEGYTEVGLLLGMREDWPARHGGVPIEHLGAAIADGNGSQARQLALDLAALGYAVAMFRDSDTTLSEKELADLRKAGVSIFEYEGGLSTEQALFAASADSEVDLLLDIACDERGEGYFDNLKARFPEGSRDEFENDFSRWSALSQRGPEATRAILAELFKTKKWIKEQRLGRRAAEAASETVRKAPLSAFGQALLAVEAWLYA